MHRGYLGLLQNFFLAGYAGHELYEAMESKTKIAIPADGMFYVSAFQSGIDHFICPFVTEGAKALSFLEKRTSMPNPDVEMDVISMVAKAFEEHRLSTGEKDSNAIRLMGFVASLLGAMRHNAALLNVMPLPDPAEITKTVAPEFAAPLIQLIAQLKPLAESLPVPVSSIECSNVRRFQALLETDTFATYSKSHAQLTDAQNDSASSMITIRKSGAALIQKSNELLTQKPSLIYLLNIVPKVVDTIFGKLPGALAQFAGNVAQDRLNDRHQIVIYQFDQWMSRVSAMRRSAAKSRS